MMPYHSNILVILKQNHVKSPISGILILLLVLKLLISFDVILDEAIIDLSFALAFTASS